MTWTQSVLFRVSHNSSFFWFSKYLTWSQTLKSTTMCSKVYCVSQSKEETAPETSHRRTGDARWFFYYAIVTDAYIYFTIKQHVIRNMFFLIRRKTSRRLIGHLVIACCRTSLLFVSLKLYTAMQLVWNKKHQTLPMIVLHVARFQDDFSMPERYCDLSVAH